MPRPRTFDTDSAVDACVEEFWDHSYATTSTDDLCRSTGLSRSSLYNAFGSKRDLYLRSLQSYNRGKAEQRATQLAATEQLTGAEALAAFATAVLADQWTDEHRRACLGINGCIEVGPHDGEITTALERNAADFDEAIRGLVARGQLDGSLDATRPSHDLAWLVHATLDGLQVRGRVHADRADVDRCVQTLLALLRPRT